MLPLFLSAVERFQGEIANLARLATYADRTPRTEPQRLARTVAVERVAATSRAVIASLDALRDALKRLAESP